MKNMAGIGSRRQSTEHAISGCKRGWHHQRMGAEVVEAELLADRGPGATAGGAGQGRGGWADTRPCAHHSSFQGARIHALGP